MKAQERIVNHTIYTRFTHAHTGYWHECFYCGEPADTVDHYPPVSRVHDYRALGNRFETYVTVSCCRECNTYLGNTLQDTLLERAEHAKDILEKKLRKDLNMPEWFDDEIEQLGSMMKKFMAAAKRRYERARKRIDYYDGVNAWTLEMPKYRIDTASAEFVRY